MNTLEYFAPGYDSIDDVTADVGPIYDASTLSKVASCPRSHEIRIEKGLHRHGSSAPMAAGLAIHAALDFYYAHAERDADIEAQAVAIMHDTWKEFQPERTQMDQKYVHMTGDFLEECLRNYWHYWNVQAIEIFQPISGLTLDDLDLSQVLAAKFQRTDNDNIILGESSLVMAFDVDGEVLVLAGKPDLPVTSQAGEVYVMDHKTTSGYLSDWWAKTHEVSNKGRGYMAMIESLLDLQTAGFVINGIYVGQYAANPDSKATKFQRFKYDFTPDHVTEALRNQLAWKKTIEFYRDLDYFPQGCGFGGCSYPDLCKRDPVTRVEVERTDYERSERKFWDL